MYGWLDGAPYDDALVDDERRAAEDLAAFVRGLHRSALPDDAPPGGRRPLRQLDGLTRASVAEAAGAVDARAVVRAWDRALDAPAWDGAPGWVHADLLRPNLLVRSGRLCAVLDFGGVGAGDPAADVIAAWSVFGPAGRAAYRDGVEVDDGTWERARGYALHQALAIVPYYATTNPAFVRTALRTVAEVLVDVGARS